MTDPKRWLDEGGGATAGERELLDAGRNARMPSVMRQRVWLGVTSGAAGVAAASQAAGAVGTGVAQKGFLSLIVGSAVGKGVAVVTLLGGASLGVGALRSQPAHRDTLSAATSLAPQGIARGEPRADEAISGLSRSENTLPSANVNEKAVTPAAPQGPVARLRATPPSRATPAAAPSLAATDDGEARESVREAPQASRLREESAAVLAIRKTLLAGDAALAVRMLESARIQFPNGVLVEEREALAVRALVASGQNGLAQKRGEAFLRAFPRSPHAEGVRAAIAR